MKNKENVFVRIGKYIIDSAQDKIIREQAREINNLKAKNLDYEKWIGEEIDRNEQLNLERVEEILKMQKVTDDASSKANYMAEQLKDEIKSSIASGKSLLNIIDCIKTSNKNSNIISIKLQDNREVLNG